MSLFEEDSNVRKIKTVKLKPVSDKPKKINLVSKQVDEKRNIDLVKIVTKKDLGDEILEQEQKFDLAKAASTRNGVAFESVQLEKKKQEKKLKADDTIIVPEINYVGDS